MPDYREHFRKVDEHAAAFDAFRHTLSSFHTPEREAALVAWHKAHPAPDPFDSPRQIELTISPFVETTIKGINPAARQYYINAYDAAQRLAKRFPILKIPAFESDTVAGVRSLRGWCIEVMQDEHSIADEKPAGDSELEPRHRKALAAYEYGAQKSGRTNIKEVHAWLEEHGAMDYDLPGESTFRKYVGKARGASGQSRRQPRGGRGGKSLAKPSDL